MNQYAITYEKNGIYHSILINANDPAIARAFFLNHKPGAIICGDVTPATGDDQRPGKPCLTVPADFIAETAEAPETTESTPESETRAEVATKSERGATPYERVITANPDCKNAWRLPGYPGEIYTVSYYDLNNGFWTCHFPTLDEYRDEIARLKREGYRIEKTTRTEAGKTEDFPIETESPATVQTLDLLDDLDTGNHGDRLNDYRDSDAYICDAITEIADADTSIYYSDILDFIRDNPDSLADVITEGLYDPAHDYDLYKHGQAAEFMTIERDIYEHLSDSLMCAAVNFIRYDLNLETIRAELAELLREWCDDADNNDRMNEIPDRIREYFEEIDAAPFDDFCSAHDCETCPFGHCASVDECREAFKKGGENA